MKKPTLSKKPLRIPHMAMARAKRPAQAVVMDAATIKEHLRNLHPPGTLPPDAQTIAMDDAISETMDWSWSSDTLAAAAGVAISSTFLEGLMFSGYPYLAQLAQRAEYRRAVEITAQEMTRQWIRLSAIGGSPGTEGRIKELTDFLDDIKLKQKARRLLEHDGYFGRGHLYLDTGDGDNRDELKMPLGNGISTLSASKVSPRKPLKALRNVEPVWTYPTNYNSNDPLREDWYKPDSWFVMGKEIHSTRLLTLITRDVPDLLKPAYSFGGLALTQMGKPYVDNWLRTRQAVADSVYKFSTSVLKTNLGESLQADGDDLFKRLDFYTMVASTKGVMALDKDSEDFGNVSIPLGSLDHLQAQAQEHLASVWGIPLVKLLGIQPSGLNASSEGEIRTFYDSIEAAQEAHLTDLIWTIIHFAQLSLWGEVDTDITWEFVPLWSLDEKSEAELHKVEADTDAVLIDSGIISPAEARKRVASDPDAPYASIDPDDVPTPPEQQAMMAGMGPPGQEGQQPPMPGGEEDTEEDQALFDPMFPPIDPRKARLDSREQRREVGGEVNRVQRTRGVESRSRDLREDRGRDSRTRSRLNGNGLASDEGDSFDQKLDYAKFKLNEGDDEEFNDRWDELTEDLDEDEIDETLTRMSEGSARNVSKTWRELYDLVDKVFGQPAMDAKWNESEHPRGGNPSNPGQFSKGSGSSHKTGKTKSASYKMPSGEVLTATSKYGLIKMLFEHPDGVTSKQVKEATGGWTKSAPTLAKEAGIKELITTTDKYGKTVYKAKGAPEKKPEPKKEEEKLVSLGKAFLNLDTHAKAGTSFHKAMGQLSAKEKQVLEVEYGNLQDLYNGLLSDYEAAQEEKAKSDLDSGLEALEEQASLGKTYDEALEELAPEEIAALKKEHGKDLESNYNDMAAEFKHGFEDDYQEEPKAEPDEEEKPVKISDFESGLAVLEEAAKQGKTYDELLEDISPHEIKAVETVHGNLKGLYEQSFLGLPKEEVPGYDVPEPPPPPAKAPAQPKQFGKITDWKKVGEQKGSNPGGTYEDNYGSKWYVKTPKTEDHARNEYLANLLYSMTGAYVPAMDLVELNGKPSVASNIIHGAKTLGETTGPAYEAAKHYAQEGFAADVWLGNRDVVGLSKDNILTFGTGKDFSIIRIDQGGSMKYRAQGDTKNFPANPSAEWNGLRDPNLNAASASIFGDMTDQQLIDSINKLNGIEKGNIEQTVNKVYSGDEANNLTNTLWYRLQVLRDYRNQLEKNPAASKTEKPKVAEPISDPIKQELSSKVGLSASNVAEVVKAAGKHGITKPEEIISLGYLQKMTGSVPHYLEKAEKRLPYGKQYGLNLVDIAHIGAYTGNAYLVLNEALRTNSLKPSQYKVMAGMKKAMAKLPVFKGNVTRGTSPPKAIRDHYKVGAVIMEPGFTSSDTKGGWHGNTKYHITTAGSPKGGKDVSQLSFTGKHEQEVLFPAHSHFEIHKVEDKGDVRHVHMTEVIEDD